MSTPIIYVCHPFGGNLNNLDSAEYWAAYLTRIYLAFFVVPWVPLCRHWLNDGETLARGIACDTAFILRSCDGLIAIGGAMSANGWAEFDLAVSAHGARSVRDFSYVLSPRELDESVDAPQCIHEWLQGMTHE